MIIIILHIAQGIDYYILFVVPYCTIPCVPQMYHSGFPRYIIIYNGIGVKLNKFIFKRFLYHRVTLKIPHTFSSNPFFH